MLQASSETEKKETPEPAKAAQLKRKGSYKRTLSSNTQIPKTIVPNRDIAENLVQEGRKLIPIRAPTAFEMVNRSRPKNHVRRRLPSETKTTGFVKLSHKDSPSMQTSQYSGLTKFINICKVM
ncbi:hypothetical protein U1Q18_043971 [Sarracenia purpurea var. burkii]